MAEVHVTTRRPPVPDDADFAISIDFKRGESNPQRIFRAADKMIQALQRVDRALCISVDANITPVMVLEDIEAGSVRIWLRDVLEAADDQALKDIDWKPALGKYLVRAKYAYIRWANKSDPDRTLMDLGKEIQSIARETDVRHFPDYAPPPIGELAEAVGEIEAAKAELSEGDSMTYITRDEAPLDFDLSVSWSIEELSEMIIKETTKFQNMPMNLIVKKPDYLGASKWDMRHGRKAISARLDDEAWLQLFQSRKIDVRPGDALKCLVTVEYHYGYDNELISESYSITKVEEVLVDLTHQWPLFVDNEK